MIYEVQYQSSDRRKYLRFTEKYSIQDAVFTVRFLFWQHKVRVVKSAQAARVAL